MHVDRLSTYVHSSHLDLQRPRWRWSLAVAAAVVVATSASTTAATASPTWRIEPVASQPPRPRGGQTRIARLQRLILTEPKNRQARFDLVLALQAAGELTRALQVAKDWRRHDAYNLLAARLVGDLHAALGHPDAALRSWSAVVELLPNDAAAHRALASALKQAGAIDAACARLDRAVALHPDDTRLAFELADCAHRQGRLEAAKQGFERISAAKDTPRLIAEPARQRLVQVYAQLARLADRAGRSAEAASLRRRRDKLSIAGGSHSDIKVFLTWDTDRSDVDLWVITPAGERIWYRHKRGKSGAALFGDVTNGYGPETFSAPRARPGVYQVIVQYFGTRRRGLREARGEVAVVLHEGTDHELRRVLPYRLYRPKQQVLVAKIHVPSRRNP